MSTKNGNMYDVDPHLMKQDYTRFYILGLVVLGRVGRDNVE